MNVYKNKIRSLQQLWFTEARWLWRWSTVLVVLLRYTTLLAHRTTTTYVNVYNYIIRTTYASYSTCAGKKKVTA